MPANPARLLTVKEVAARLGLSPGQVLGLIAYRRIAAVNVGTGPRRPLWRISPEALETFTAGRNQGAEAPQPAPGRRTLPEGVIEFF